MHAEHNESATNREVQQDVNQELNRAVFALDVVISEETPPVLNALRDLSGSNRIQPAENEQQSEGDQEPPGVRGVLVVVHGRTGRATARGGTNSAKRVTVHLYSTRNRRNCSYGSMRIHRGSGSAAV